MRANACFSAFRSVTFRWSVLSDALQKLLECFLVGDSVAIGSADALRVLRRGGKNELEADAIRPRPGMLWQGHII